jgi:hypothetical protein
VNAGRIWVAALVFFFMWTLCVIGFCGVQVVQGKQGFGNPGAELSRCTSLLLLQRGGLKDDILSTLTEYTVSDAVGFFVAFCKLP